ncbi:MAG: hypothetical protein F4148_07105 [Caldilineaceae bacterium SB0675_bin_29]|uniref:Uncharacterized protein n=1 Tax=Caldilineaceae bacterium SB0675_bin_29 TaxID=2605266 RepID=A0A6B1FY39_9CHLR|nr:hypothetical protein [Caldilineaceae bacterium SB0675_bin_29]
MERPTEKRRISKTPNSGHIDLRKQGIDENLAAELRAGFATFAEDWDAPEMDICDEVFAHDQVKDENPDLSTC